MGDVVEMNSKKNGAATKKVSKKTAEAATKPAEATKPSGPIVLNETPVHEVRLVKRGEIIVNQANNARGEIDIRKPDDKLVGLAIDVHSRGLLNPLTVRLRPDGKLELSAGYRRYFATGPWKGLSARELTPDQRSSLNVIHTATVSEDGETFDLPEMEMVPVTVLKVDEVEASIVNAVENLQREDLTQFEIGRSIWRIKEESKKLGINGGEGYNPSEIARKVGYSRSAVSNMLAWQKLIPKFKRALEDGVLTAQEANKFCYMKQDDQRTAFDSWQERRAERPEPTSGKGGKGRSEGGKEAQMLRKPKIEELLRIAKDVAEDIRISGSFATMTDEMREAVVATLKYVLAPPKNRPLFKPMEVVEEEEEEGGDDE